MTRALLVLLALALLAAAALVLRQRWPGGEPVEVAPSAAESGTPGTAPGANAAGEWRLAGLAVGEPGSFAVFEDPAGETALFRLGDDVTGLGKLTAIEEGRALITGSRGVLEFRVRPAPTATRDPRAGTLVTKTPAPTIPSPAPGGTAEESPASASPDRSVS